MHVHAIGSNGEAKFWMEPKIKLEMSKGFSSSVVNHLEKLVIENEKEIRNAWNRHFQS